MKRTTAMILAALLLFSLFPLYSAPAFADTKKETPEEHYTIGEDENTFKGLYARMCTNLDLKKYPIPITDEKIEGRYNGGEYEEVHILKDDDTSYEYIGYLYSWNNAKQYIIWNWMGFHKDGTVIGMDVYYTLDGKYLGNIQHNYTDGTATSSHNSPYNVPGQPLNKE